MAVASIARTEMDARVMEPSLLVSLARKLAKPVKVAMTNPLAGRHFCSQSSPSLAPNSQAGRPWSTTTVAAWMPVMNSQ